MPKIDEPQEIFVEKITFGRTGLYVSFNVPPHQVFSYIPGIQKRTRLKNQTKTIHFPWVYSDTLVLRAIKQATIYDTEQWVYVENEYWERIRTYQFVFFSGLKTRHAPNKHKPNQYQFSRTRSLLRNVTLEVIRGED